MTLTMTECDLLLAVLLWRSGELEEYIRKAKLGARRKRLMAQQDLCLALAGRVEGERARLLALPKRSEG